MHQANKKEIEAAELRAHLKTAFAKILTDARSIEKAVDRFLNVIQERKRLAGGSRAGSVSLLASHFSRISGGVGDLGA